MISTILPAALIHWVDAPSTIPSLLPSFIQDDKCSYHNYNILFQLCHDGNEITVESVSCRVPLNTHAKFAARNSSRKIATTQLFGWISCATYFKSSRTCEDESGGRRSVVDSTSHHLGSNCRVRMTTEIAFCKIDMTVIFCTVLVNSMTCEVKSTDTSESNDGQSM